MKVEYKAYDSKALFWYFECPADVSFSGDKKLELDFETIVEAVGVVGKSLLVKYKRESEVIVAHKGLHSMVRRLGFTIAFDSPSPLDRVHLHKCGFYWSDEKLQEFSDPFVDILSGEALEDVIAVRLGDVETRTAEKEKAQKHAEELRTSGQIEKAQELEAEAQEHARVLEVLAAQLRLLSPGGPLMLETPKPSEPSSGSTELSVAAGSGGIDERIAAVGDREEELKERVEEHHQANVIRWIYGSCDTLVVNVKKKPLKSQRIQYVLSKNPKPSPIEFAKLYMEITDLEQRCKSGKAAFDSCKEAHQEYDKNFKFLRPCPRVSSMNISSSAPLLPSARCACEPLQRA